MILFDYLEKATLSGLIHWEPTGEEAEFSSGIKLKGYRGSFEEHQIRLIVVQGTYTTGFFKKEVHKTVAVGISIIDKGGKQTTFTDDPEKIPGEKKDEVFCGYLRIHRWIESQRPEDSLARAIASRFVCAT